MFLLTANVFLNILGLIIALVVTFYTYFKWSFQYWARKGVPFLPPSIPFGNIDNVITRKRNFGTIIKDLHDELKAKGAKFGGFYRMTRPCFLPIDPEIIRNILTKDFK